MSAAPSDTTDTGGSTAVHYLSWQVAGVAGYPVRDLEHPSRYTAALPLTASRGLLLRPAIAYVHR